MPAKFNSLRIFQRLSGNVLKLSIPLLPTDWLQCSPDYLASLAPLETVNWSPFAERGLRLSIKREDLLGEQLGGNKVYKLYGHLHKARQLFGKELKLASFGGAWSNHLYALAAAAQQLRIPALAIVRGEAAPQASAMLQDLHAKGVRVQYVAREEYRLLKSLAADGEYEKLDAAFGEHYWIPEGGGSLEGTLALAALPPAIIKQSAGKVDVIAHACGTGTSLAGLLRGAGSESFLDVKFLGVAVLKAGTSLDEEVQHLLERFGDNTKGSVKPTWEIDKENHCGGYAKLPGYLLEFMRQFEAETGVPLDPIYTAKLLYGLSQRAQAGQWQAGTHIVAIHSGGLQGRRGWERYFS